jgi:hypothetical protein
MKYSAALALGAVDQPIALIKESGNSLLKLGIEHIEFAEFS